MELLHERVGVNLHLRRIVAKSCHTMHQGTIPLSQRTYLPVISPLGYSQHQQRLWHIPEIKRDYECKIVS